MTLRRHTVDKLKSALERDRLRGRPAPLGFVLAAAVSSLLEREPNEAQRVLDAIAGDKPPTQCPSCGFACSFAVRDAEGQWTWCCLGGCNP